jgi:hypothetical protein
MTVEELRDRFAEAALQQPRIWAMAYVDGRPQGFPEIARRCYIMADAMMAERARSTADHGDTRVGPDPASDQT